MRTKKTSLFLLLLSAWMCLLAVAPAVQAQTGTSRITGTVTDQTGAVLPGATATAMNEATGVRYTTTTTTAGTYALDSLPVGTYTVTVQSPGFRTFTSTGNVLTVGAPLVVDATMEIGQPTEIVEVVGTYERIETKHAMLSDVVSRREIVELPLNGRNPLALITLQPGLLQRTNNAAGSGTHVFGSRDRAHNVTIDGIDANESSVPNPQSNIYRLNANTVQEFRVVTHNATPEFGRNSGAQVAIATRSGTNEYHGDVYWFHRNTALNANEWFNNVKGIERPVLLLNQFGASGGGPVIKNKTFFFASWQGNRIVQKQPISASFGIPRVYTDSLRSGLFRYFVPDPARPLVIDGVTITRNSPLLVDPRTGALRAPLCATPTSVGCVRTYSIFASDPLRIGADRTITAMIAKFPLPNTFAVGDGLNFGGFAWNPPSRFVGPHYMIRLDHKLNENNNLFGRFLWSDWDTKDGDFLNSRPQVFPGFSPLGEVFRASQNLALGYRRVFSPNLVNELTTGFSRFHFFFSLRESNSRGGIEPPPYGQECFGTDSFSDSEASTAVLMDTPFCNTPHTRRAVSNIQFVDNLSYIQGAHTIRTGLNIRFYRHNDERGVPGGFNMSPTIIFDRSIRDPGFPAAPGIHTEDNVNLLNAVAALVGIPARVQQVFLPDFKKDVYIPDLFTLGTRTKQFNLYLQDEWRLRRDLTLTYGLRWELNLPPADEGDRTFVPDRAIDGSQGPVTYVRAKRWFQRNNAAAFAPRIGLAWSPWDTKTVIRAGYGIAFDPISTFQVTAIGGKVPGGVLQCRVNVQDSAAASAPCSDIPNDIRLGQLLATSQPFTLPAPTARPSTELSPANRPFLVAPNVGAFDPNLKLPTVHEWSLTLQRELPWNFVGQVGYIGKRGLHLLRGYDLNQIRADQPGFLESFLIAQQNVARGCNADGTGNCVGGQTPTLLLQLVPASFLNSSATRRNLTRNGLGDLARRTDQRDIVSRGFPANYFRPNAQFSEIFYVDSGGDSYYHGFIAQLRRRFEKGLEFGLSYTLSKSIDNMSVDPVAASSGGGLSSTNSRTPTDVRNFRLDRSLSDFDNTHVVVSHAVYDLPFGRGRAWGDNLSGWANHLFGGWTVTGIFNFQTGEPYTINSGIRTANGFKVSRAELIGSQPSGDLQTADGGPIVFRVDDLDASRPNCRRVVGTESFFCLPPPGSHGMGRNALRGPGLWNFDFGVIKKFGMTERFNLEFRGEFFNLFNHPNFENPRNATEGSPTLTSSLFGQTCCITSSLPSSATVIATGEPNRVIQFALKLSF